MNQFKGIFIVWKQYQRRVEVLAPLLGLEAFFLFYSWEEKSKLHKAIAYGLKALHTTWLLFQKMPRIIFVQFPPPPALYCIALYSWLAGVNYIVDCHFGITNARWLRWICTKKLLAKGKVIVHNQHLIEQVVTDIGVRPLVVRDGIAPKRSMTFNRSQLLEDLDLTANQYVIFPCSFSPDEPVEEVIGAAWLLPDTKFVMTWNFNKLTNELRNSLPPNVLLTGYLPIDDFNTLFANSGVALVLTNHEAVQLSGMQEAMAFEIPAVVTNLKTTRFLYKDYPVYVNNNPESIANGIRQAFKKQVDLKNGMGRLRIETEKEFFEQLATLKLSMNLDT